MIKLTVIAGPDLGNEFSFDREVIVIGRSSQCDLMLHDAALGRQHCEIRCEDNTFILADLASLNGTYLNDQPERIKTEVLRTGDEILLGKSCLRVELPESARQAPPRSPTRARENSAQEPVPQIAGSQQEASIRSPTYQPQPPPQYVAATERGEQPAASTVDSSQEDFTVASTVVDQLLPRISLRVIVGNDVGKVFEPAPGISRFTVGRVGKRNTGDCADWMLDDQRISRIHFAIELTPTGFILTDQGSRNGTFVTGHPDRIQRLELRGGEEIRIGQTTLQVNITSPAPRAPSLLTESPPWQIQLQVLEGNDVGKVFELVPGTTRFTVGRGESADWVLDDRRISRIHFAIELTPTGFVLVDEGSSNGTFIGDNTERIQRHELRDGDEIRLGHTCLRSTISGPTDTTVVGLLTPPLIPTADSRNVNVISPPQYVVQPKATLVNRFASLPRPWVIFAAVFSATVCCAAFFWLGAPTFFSSGAIALGHAPLENKCRTCHSPWGVQPIGGTCGTSDCHASVLQVSAQKTDRCESCHTEHRGRQFNIKGDATRCWQCHAAAFQGRPIWRYYGPVFSASQKSTRTIYQPALPTKADQLATWQASTPRTETNLIFAHAIHAEVSGLKDCLSCHQPLPGTVINVLGTGSAFPSHTECIDCHREVGNQDPRQARADTQCRMCHTREDGQVTRVSATLSFVRFSHDNHKTTACETCHFMISKEMTYQPTKRASLYALPMEFCVSCHEQESAPTSCLTCHRTHHHILAQVEPAGEWSKSISFGGILLLFLTGEIGVGVYMLTRFRT